MNQTNRYKIIIVGGGPAGLAAALHIAQKAPALTPDILILEAAEHPRHKLCGGGITFHGEEQLARLGLCIDVPGFTVHRLLFRLGAQVFAVQCRDAMRVIQRDEFDAALAQAVQTHGICLHANERLVDIQPTAEGVTLTTDQACYQAVVAIAADGANSTVRRKLRFLATAGVARLLRVLTPIDAAQDELWQANTTVFDFSCVMRGIQGYMWDFPCVRQGDAYMNRGIFDSRIEPQPAAERPHGNLKHTFEDALQRRRVDLNTVPLEGHPVRWFNPEAEFSRPHILLTGDAAGVDPLFAEGISYAMEYGEIVADLVKEAFETRDFSFHNYRQRLLNHRLGRLLRRRTFVARHLYLYRYPRLWSILWSLASISPRRMQQFIGAALGLLPPTSLRRTA